MCEEALSLWLIGKVYSLFLWLAGNSRKALHLHLFACGRNKFACQKNLFISNTFSYIMQFSSHPPMPHDNPQSLPYNISFAPPHKYNFPNMPRVTQSPRARRPNTQGAPFKKELMRWGGKYADKATSAVPEACGPLVYSSYEVSEIQPDLLVDAASSSSHTTPIISTSVVGADLSSISSPSLISGSSSIFITASASDAASAPSSATASVCDSAFGPKLLVKERIVRLYAHLPGVDKALKVHAESVEELQADLQKKLKAKHPEVAIVPPLQFTTAPPGCAARPALEIDEQMWALADDTSVWLLPTPTSLQILVTVPSVSAPVTCVAYSLISLQHALKIQQPKLSEGVFFTTTDATSASAVGSWDEVMSLPSPVQLFAAWHWCAVPLNLQLLINPQLDAAHGICAICSRPLAHNAHLMRMH
jgi:hypothetical protein